MTTAATETKTLDEVRAEVNAQQRQAPSTPASRRAAAAPATKTATQPTKTTTRKPTAAKPTAPASKAATATKAAPKARKPRESIKVSATGAPDTKKTEQAAKRAGKRDLATRLVLAAAEMVKGLGKDELAAIGMTKAEAAVCVSSWIHHIPADRDQWVKVLPKPDRSDWK